MAASKRSVLQFFSTQSLSGKVHPLVIFNICDCYVRCPDQAERVIGMLLGSVLPNGTVDIRNSYAVPHNESVDQVALDIEYHHNMLLSHQKVNPKEVIVGWYSTGLGVTGGSALIHEFYSREVSNPIHLTIDTGFADGEGSIKAYVSNSLSLFLLPFDYAKFVFCRKMGKSNQKQLRCSSPATNRSLLFQPRPFQTPRLSCQPGVTTNLLP